MIFQGMNHFLIIVFCLLTPIFSCFSQEKWEKESRLKEHDVPQAALLFFQDLPKNIRIKWFLEENQDRKSIEAKFKRNKQHYSVEFDSLGVFEDLEIEMKWDEIDPTTQIKIKEQLDSVCSKNKLVKIQTQFLDPKNQLKRLIDFEKNLTLIKNYEVVVRCTNEKQTQLIEYLFSETGLILKSTKIVSKNSSHLEF